MERVWIYPADRKLNQREITAIREFLANFTANWHAHGKKLRAGFDVRYDRFIILWADETHEMPSGCSIDESTRTIKQIESAFGLSLFNNQMMYWLDGEEVRSCDFREAGDLYEREVLKNNTPVFNPLVKDFPSINSDWVIPFNRSGYYNFVKQQPA